MVETKTLLLSPNYGPPTLSGGSNSPTNGVRPSPLTLGSKMASRTTNTSGKSGPGSPGSLPFSFRKNANPNAVRGAPVYSSPVPLARGASGMVSMVKRNSDGEKFAVKKISTGSSNRRRAEADRELDILRCLTEAHRVLQLEEGGAAPGTETTPWVTTLCDYARTETSTHFYLPLCEGGNLSQALKRPGVAAAMAQQEEAILKPMFRSLLEKVQWMHNTAGIYHLDLKPEQLLFPHPLLSNPSASSPSSTSPTVVVSPKDAASLVISDFGLSTMDSRVHTCRGTPGFIPPELLLLAKQKQRQSHSDPCSTSAPPLPTNTTAPFVEASKVDIFAIGAILFEILLGGENPFFFSNASQEAEQEGGSAHSSVNVNTTAASAQDPLDAGWVHRTLAVDELLLQTATKNSSGGDALLQAAVTPELLDFLAKTMCANPEQRLSATELLNHPWLCSSKNNKTILE